MDILYIFNFEPQHLAEAIKRFRCSLKSLAGQGGRICVSNNSQICIRPLIEDVAPEMSYMHCPYNGPFSRAHGINFGVRTLVQSEYFLISDVDLVYRRTHISAVMEKLQKSIDETDRPVRLVFWNYNLQPHYWPKWMNRRFLRRFAKKSAPLECSDYNALATLPNNGGGFAHGNGVIHLESFLRLRGYDEEMIGYGPEDDLFNTRIGKVNRIIYDKGDDTASIHLWHPRLRMIQPRTNMEIWRERKAYYNSLAQPGWEDVMANKQRENWGEVR